MERAASVLIVCALRLTRAVRLQTRNSREAFMSMVEIVLKEGPVLIPSLAGSGVDRTCPLWSDITASEFFPPNVESAFYILSLRKQVGDPVEVPRAEGDLVSALRMLSMAWPFSGGSFMVLDSRIVPPLARQDVDHLYFLARTWIRSHLKAVGLPAP